MIRYVDFIQTEYKGHEVSSFGMINNIYERLIEISFIGMEFEDDVKKITDTTSVTVRLLEKEKNKNIQAPFKECWTINFPNVLVPTGVWNGIKLGQFADDRFFVAMGTFVMELDLKGGEILWSKEYANTPVVKIGVTRSKHLLILYSDYLFKKKPARSNLIKIDLKGDIAWSAKTKSRNDVFTNFNYRDNELYASTWDGWHLKLDEANGIILDAEWTK